jgi:hypothetical protein
VNVPVVPAGRKIGGESQEAIRIRGALGVDAEGVVVLAPEALGQDASRNSLVNVPKFPGKAAVASKSSEYPIVVPPPEALRSRSSVNSVARVNASNLLERMVIVNLAWSVAKGSVRLTVSFTLNWNGR